MYLIQSQQNGVFLYTVAQICESLNENKSQTLNKKREVKTLAQRLVL